MGLGPCSQSSGVSFLIASARRVSYNDCMDADERRDLLREERGREIHAEWLRVRREKREAAWAETWRMREAARKNMSGLSSAEAGGRVPAELHRYRVSGEILKQIKWEDPFAGGW